MDIRLIYADCVKNNQIEFMLLQIFGGITNISCASEKAEYENFLKNDSIIISAGGFYSGKINAPKLASEQFGLKTKWENTCAENEFENGNGIIQIPENAEPYFDRDDVLWGFSCKSDDRDILFICEPENALIYQHSGALYNQLLKIKNAFSSNEAEQSDELEQQEPITAEPQQDDIITQPEIPEDITEPEAEPETAEQPAETTLDTNEEMGKLLDELFGAEDGQNEKLELYNQPVLADFRDEKRKKSHGLLIAIIVIICLVAASVGAFFSYDRYIVPDAYDKAAAHCRSVYSAAANTEKPPEYLPEFGVLYKENKNIGGWISIDGTKINLPVMYYKNGDYYSNHLYNDNRNKYGTPYFASNYKPLEYNYNTAIYGKNYSDSRAFADLTKYIRADFVEKNPIIVMNTVTEKMTWKIFAVVQYDDNKYNPAKNSFFDDEEFLEFISGIQKYTTVTTSIEADANDQLLTLITDYKSSRGNKLAVVARLIRPGEDNDGQDVEAEQNDNVVIATDTQPTSEEQTLPVNATVQQSSGMSVTVSSAVSGATSASQQHTSAGVTVKTTSGAVAHNTTSTAKPTAKPTPKPTSAPTTAPTTKPIVPVQKIRAKDQDTGTIYYDEAPAIIARIIEAEMGGSYEPEALKSQAVAAYTYLLYNGAASGSAPAAPMRTPTARSILAANAVVGQTLKYNGNLCNSVYYAMSAGKTANCSEVWSADLPYLRSVDSSVDKNISGFQTTRVYSAKNVASWVEAQYGVKLSSVSDKTKWFVCTYDANRLYAKTVSLGGLKSVKGIDIRYNLFTAARAGSSNVLRSHAFTVEYRSSDDSFVFTVKGYGHGVGMSQVGANQYAKKGWNYKQILQHYYTGAAIS